MTSWSVIAGETPTATKWNVLGTNDAEFNSRIDQLVEDKTLGVTSDASTVTFDLNVRKVFSVTLGGNRIFALDNLASSIGIPFSIRVKQGAGGNRLVTDWFGVGITKNWPEGAEPPLSVGVGEIDYFNFVPISETEIDCLFASFTLRPPA